MRRCFFVCPVAEICCGLLVQLAISAEAPPKRYTETVADRLGEKTTFDMVLIDGGSFNMGSPADEAGRRADEGPQRQIRLKPFYMATTETTLRLFLAYYKETNRARTVHVETVEGNKDVDAVTGPTPYFGELTMGYEPDHPAIGATWHNATTFCRWLSKKTGKTYRLPTEAEWEYAARAGTTTPFFFGKDGSNVGDYAWCAENSGGKTHPVATKKPNAWGLYDMAGNVSEWVEDFYASSYKEGEAVNADAAGGAVHVARGGDYNSPCEELRSAAREFEQKWWRSGDPQIPKSLWWLPNMDIIGLRVARSVEPEKTAEAAPRAPGL